MTALLVSIADAVKDALNDGNFSRSFIAERSYADWDMVLEDFGNLYVDVVPVADPGDNSFILEDRNSVLHRIGIDVGVRRRFENIDQDNDGLVAKKEIDDLCEFLEEISEFFPPGKLIGFTAAEFESARVRVWWVPQLLRQSRQYTGIVRVNWVVDSEL